MATLERPHDASHADVVAAIEADPVGLEIMWGRLTAIVDEMWETVCRTAFSLIISDAQDFSVALFDAAGDMLGHSPRAMPVFNLSLPRAINSLLARFPLNVLQPGDVLITNDPWLASGHLFDCAVVTPVFHGGRIVGHVGMIGHVSDIGGTKNASAARELFEEGLQIPPMKLFKAGAANDDLLALIKDNVREPALVVADLLALVSASSIGVARLQDFLSEYRLPDLLALAEVFYRRSETAMREAISAIPDGVYESEVSARIGEHDRTLPVRIVVEDDKVVVDLAGSPPEVERGGYNCTLNYTISHALFPLKCLMTPSLRGNAGCYRPFTVKAPPEGTLLNCRKPASVSTRQLTGWLIGPNVFAALAGALPDKVRAFSGMPGGVIVYGVNAADEPCIGYLLIGGGQGASGRDDGRSGLLFPAGGTTPSTELFEQRVDLIIEHRQFEPDSGGAGRHRGGLGQTIRLGKLPGDQRPLQYLLLQRGGEVLIPAMLGGCPGAGVSAALFKEGVAVAAEDGLQTIRELATGEAFEFRTAGGYGYGDPLTRELDRIEADLEGGYVTQAQAETLYGCVFTSSGKCDRALTAARRQHLLADAQPAPKPPVHRQNVETAERAGRTAH